MRIHSRGRIPTVAAKLTDMTILFMIVLLVLHPAMCSAKKLFTSLPIDLPQDKMYAYVTLLYSDDFALGVRTLGQSLRETQDPNRSNIDHLVLVTPRVGPETRSVLESEGWMVEAVTEHSNPNKNFDKRLHGVYTKLEIFRLTKYHRVVFLDADTTVLENVDELFLCGPFCAVMRHSELINTGVLVVEPSQSLHKDLSEKVEAGLYSYTGGDQGFLNTYYQDYAACPYFEPMKQIGLGSDGSKCRRLPHRYNGDWPIAMLNGKLEMVRTRNSMQEEFGEFRRSRIMHFTFGGFKPWDWYSAAIFPFTHHWTIAAARLPQSRHDKRLGRNEVLSLRLGLAYAMMWILVVWHGCRAPSRQVSLRKSSNACCSTSNPVKWIYLSLRHHMQPRNTTTHHHAAVVDRSNWSHDPLSKGSLCLHLLVGYTTLLFGAGVGWNMVPRHTHKPMMGFAIFLVWTFGVFFSVYSLYIFRWFLQGEALRMATSAKSADLEPDHDALFLSLASSNNNSTNNNSTNSTSSVLPTTPSNLSRHAGAGRASFRSARVETFTYGTVLVIVVALFVLHRIRSYTVSFGQVILPLIVLALTTLGGSTIVFYRLPLLWYQEGMYLSTRIHENL